MGLAGVAGRQASHMSRSSRVAAPRRTRTAAAQNCSSRRRVCLHWSKRAWRASSASSGAVRTGCVILPGGRVAAIGTRPPGWLTGQSATPIAERAPYAAQSAASSWRIRFGSRPSAIAARFSRSRSSGAIAPPPSPSASAKSSSYWDSKPPGENVPVSCRARISGGISKGEGEEPFRGGGVELTSPAPTITALHRRQSFRYTPRLSPE